MKKLFLLFFAILFFALRLSYAKTIELFYEDESIAKVKVETKRGATYIDINDAAALFKGQVQWYPVSKKTALSLNNYKIIFVANDKNAWVGSKKMMLPSSPWHHKNSLFLPIDFFTDKEFEEISEYEVSFKDSQLKANKITDLVEKTTTTKENLAVLPQKPLIIPTLPGTQIVADSKSKKKQTTISIAPPQVKKIVVDAGHGGKDPGAVGRKGTKEKEINLLIALELAQTLQDKGFDVLLTREDDTFIPLHERCQIANNWQADIFISIHCNASIRRSQDGFEIYFLSDKASDRAAAETEQLENAVLKLEDPKEHADKVKSLLFSMAQNEFINESSLLCHTIARRVKNIEGVFDRGVKQANFHVLRGSKMPAVLVESGFLTNDEEERKLNSKRFRNELVEMIIQGINDYEKNLSLLQEIPL